MFGIKLDLTKSKIHSPVTLSVVYSADTKPVVHIAEIVLILFPLASILGDTGVSPLNAYPYLRT